jgi:hypothetical protein
MYVVIHIFLIEVNLPMFIVYVVFRYIILLLIMSTFREVQ